MALVSKSRTTKSGAGRQTLQLKIDDRDLRALLATFGKMDDIAKNDMRKIAASISEKVANEVRYAASQSGKPAVNNAIMQSLKISKSDKAPNFSLGGSPRVTSRGTKAGEILFGAEFGSNKYRQFPPHLGKTGYFIFPTLRKMQRSILAEWLSGYKLIRDAWVKRVI